MPTFAFRAKQPTTTALSSSGPWQRGSSYHGQRGCIDDVTTRNENDRVCLWSLVVAKRKRTSGMRNVITH
ncbi:unnamed protein product [Lasius platythorax]|uniref:Uncharacterized protein n=1 Tax=Lasius platythorax TaxID=488582 RepID=A0AAV2NHP0_9HYME